MEGSTFKWHEGAVGEAHPVALRKLRPAGAHHAALGRHLHAHRPAPPLLVTACYQLHVARRRPAHAIAEALAQVLHEMQLFIYLGLGVQ
jgi:hypothetical protein